MRQRDDGLEMQFDPVGLEGLEDEPHAAGLLGRGPAHGRQQGRLGKACRRHLVHKGEPRSRHRRSAGPDAILFPGGPGEVPQEAQPVPPPARACAGPAEPPGSLPSRAAALRGSAAPLPTCRHRTARPKTTVKISKPSNRHDEAGIDWQIGRSGRRQDGRREGEQCRLPVSRGPECFSWSSPWVPPLPLARRICANQFVNRH